MCRSVDTERARLCRENKERNSEVARHPGGTVWAGSVLPEWHVMSAQMHDLAACGIEESTQSSDAGDDWRCWWCCGCE